jgi:hypothetical protein
MCALEGVCGSTPFAGVCIALFSVAVIALATWGIMKLTDRRNSRAGIEGDRTSVS